MRCMGANARQMWHSSRTSVEVTEGGIGTGEYVDVWADPVGVRMNASAPTGDASSSPFGTATEYDLTAVAASNPLGIREGDRLWLRDEPPASGASLDPDGLYVVGRVSQSLNSVSFGLRRAVGS